MQRRWVIVLVAALLCASAGPTAASGAQSEHVREVQRKPGPDLAFPSGQGRLTPSVYASKSAISRGKLSRKLRGLAKSAPGASGVFVYDLSARKKRVLYERKGGKRRKLASNTKLFTTATALGELGAGTYLTSRVKAQGKLTRAGKLKGSLYLIGAGDPSFGAYGISKLAEDIRAAGIKRVKGTVVGDDSLFDRVRGVPDSGWGASEYIAPLSALTYGGSTYSGDPAAEAAQELRDALRDAGVKIGGRVKVGNTPKKLGSNRVVADYGSPPLSELINTTNKYSNNFYAEILLKRIAADGPGKGTTRKGTKIVKRYAKGLGSKVDPKDGSGLTDNNKASPRDVVRLLAAMRKVKGAKNPFYKSLSIAGEDGTLAERMRGTAAQGSCRGKTGTINGVSNVSGYCKSRGQMVAFSILMNGVSSYDSARWIQDQMVAQIARYRG